VFCVPFFRLYRTFFRLAGKLIGNTLQRKHLMIAEAIR
jgi:hypothetical protein